MSAGGAALPPGSLATLGMTRRYAFFIDRNQSTPEAFAVAALVFVTTVVEVTALLPFRLWISALLAIVVTPWLLQIPLYVFGLLFRSEKVTSIAILTLVAITAGFVAAQPTPARFVMWFFFGAFALNALAWVIVQLLRSRMQALEQECGV